MKANNKIQLKSENFKDCSVICNHDCPLGQLFDFSCEFQSFIRQKIKESEEQANKKENEIVES